MSRPTTQSLSFLTAAALPRPPRRRLPRKASSSATAAPPSSPPSLPTPTKASPWLVTKALDRCLRLSLTLGCGQAFRWADCGTVSFPRAHGGRAREWAGVVGTRLLVLRQAAAEPPPGAEDPVWFRVEAGTSAGARAVVRDYLRLAHDQSALVATFCDADPRFNHVFPYLRGTRVIRSDPAECLFSFICSSNNNIKRIVGMVQFLAMRYGALLGEYEGQEHYVFPSVKDLARDATEDELREAGFGYRAKYIVGTALRLQEMADKEGVSAEDMLLAWRKLGRREVATRLVQFPGIGRKVAGCVALFSLDKLGEIPVDTHIWQIAVRCYMPSLKQKSLTDRVYDQVGALFRDRFGEETAGLAQTMLFSGELPDFKTLLPEHDVGKGVKRKRKGEPAVVKLEKEEEELVCGIGNDARTAQLEVKEEDALVEEKPLMSKRVKAEKKEGDRGSRL